MQLLRKKNCLQLFSVFVILCNFAVVCKKRTIPRYTKDKIMARVITMGEIMLRLSSPGNSRFIQSDSFDVNYGGGESFSCISSVQVLTAFSIIGTVLLLSVGKMLVVPCLACAATAVRNASGEPS